MGAFVQSCEWQFMHVLVGGIPANDEFSTDVWQYRQSMPSPPTWCMWLNWMGCSTNSFCFVAQDDRMATKTSKVTSPINPMSPPNDMRERALALRGKI
jgi:hypothetical protein